MSTTQPIKNTEALERFRNYYFLQKPKPRNGTLIILGLNTALRISDVLLLKWGDVYDEEKGKAKDYLEVVEKKTGKNCRIALNQVVRVVLQNYWEFTFQGKSYEKEQYLFLSQKGKMSLLAVHRRIGLFVLLQRLLDWRNISVVILFGKRLDIMLGNREHLRHF